MSLKLASMTGAQAFNYDGGGDASYGGASVSITPTGFDVSGTKANESGITYWWMAKTGGGSAGTCGTGQTTLSPAPQTVWLVDSAGRTFFKTAGMPGDTAWEIGDGAVGPVSCVELNASGFMVTRSGSYFYLASDTAVLDAYPTISSPNEITRPVGGDSIVAATNTSPLNGSIAFRAAGWVGAWPMSSEGYFSARDGGMVYIAGIPTYGIKLEPTQVRFGPGALENVNPAGFTVYSSLE
jgi:hypothetical protein